MNTQPFLLSAILGLLLTIAGCDTEDELIEERLENNPLSELSGTPGSIDFSKYVALGNSLSAGFMDGALYDNGQANSFPNILAQHLAQVKGIAIGAFSQPDINSANGFNTSVNDLSNPSANPIGRFVLDLTIPGPVPVAEGDPIAPYDGDKAALNNFAVPGIRVIEAVVPGYGTANPFFGRFASDPATTSVLADAMAAQATFFTVWLGSGDVLGWATAGGAPADAELTPEAEATSGTLTSLNSFAAAYQAVIDGMLSNGANGVAITLPPVTLVPFFRLVPPRPIALAAEEAEALNAGYADYNNGLNAAVALGLIDEEEVALRTISFAEGEGNGVVMLDETLESLDISSALQLPEGSVVLPNIRQTNDTDLLPLPIASRLGVDSGNGSFGLQVPADDSLVLTQSEQVQLVTRTAQFNGIIAQIVASTGGRVALLDINPLFVDLFGLTAEQATQLGLGEAAVSIADGEVGIVTDEAVLQPDFSPGGIFSTDGIHPNPKGHAIVANAVINTINESFESASIPFIDVAPYATVATAPQ